jgi:nucleotide-binding universal stress UspA family protein
MSATEGSEMPRIVVGVDGSEHSMDAVKWAAHQAELMGAELVLVSVWGWPKSYGDPTIGDPTIGGPMPMPPPDYNPATHAEHDLDAAEQTVRKAHPELPLRRLAIDGPPAPVLVEASSSATLLVVGSRGRGAFMGMLLGSVSQHCVTNAKCPVVVIRNED